MSDLVYAYKPKPVVMALGAVFFALCAAFFANNALTNDRGLIIDGLIRLDIGQATVFYWIMLSAGAAMSLAGLVGLIRGLTSAQTLIIGATAIQVPKSPMGNNRVSVAYADIRDMVRTQVRNQVFLVIHHSRGKLTIMASMLPSRAKFEEVCQLLTERVHQAQVGQ